MTDSGTVRRFVWRVLVAASAGLSASGGAQAAPENASTPVVSIDKVFTDGRHNAFTDLVEWRGACYLAFRNATGHGSFDGDLVILKSADRKKWAPAVRIATPGDDRDPSFLATDRRLFVYFPTRFKTERTELHAYVSFTDDGARWSPPAECYDRSYVVWKPKAFGGRFYAGAHVIPTTGNRTRQSELVESVDGLTWRRVAVIHAVKTESETAIHFFPSGRAMALVRNQAMPRHGWACFADPPYQKWSAEQVPMRFEGHNIWALGDQLLVGSRYFERSESRTALLLYHNGTFNRYAVLPSGGDTSYVGMVPLDADRILVSYYSSHEGPSSIYVAVLKRP